MGNHAPLYFFMHTPTPVTPLTVAAAEHGMKLISFLARRLENSASTSELHRWIRTGQVRVNGKRAAAFDRVATGDAVRLPPFASPAARHEAKDISVAPGDILGGTLRVLAVTPDFLALEKPVGIPSQPGTKQDTSVSGILRDHFAGAAYIPAPAHRLDKPTSGILLAGRTHNAQERLHALFARDSGTPGNAQGNASGNALGNTPGDTSMEKVYLAWVCGAWPHADEQTLSDRLAKEAGPGTGYETVQASGSEGARDARSCVSHITTRTMPFGDASLLRVVLETGRTHQIRVQLAIRNFPIIGDLKYGGRAFSPMLLHAYALSFPWNGESVSICSPPPWPEPFAVALPPFVA